jgi:chaperonin GroEL (HSP60 family)
VRLLWSVQVGGERYNLFTDCPQARTATIVLRGGSEQFIDEAERSLHDAIMIVRRALKHAHVVAGGGAIDMEVGHSTVQRLRPEACCTGMGIKCLLWLIDCFKYCLDVETLDPW